MPVNSQDQHYVKPTDYPNIIFDFGGVILNIDVRLTIDAFKELSPSYRNDSTPRIIESRLLHNFEMGRIEEEAFKTGLREILKIKPDTVSDSQLYDAWNALILDIPVARLELLKKISENHRIFLLSNTNVIHMRKVSEVVQQTTGKPEIDDLFENAYYSHLIHMRKPDTDIYEYVIQQNDLNPVETLFLDDNPVNLKGAEKTGLATWEVKPGDEICKIFSV